MKTPSPVVRSRWVRGLTSLPAAACLALLPATLLLACGGEPEPQPVDAAQTQAADFPETSEAPGAQASLVLISIDTLRSDHVGTYGGDVETPHLDALASEGIVFERAYSHVPLTLPAHLSMLTGLLPTRHGVRDNIGYRSPTDRLPYVPQLLNQKGYRTAAAISTRVLQGDGGLALGFDLYDDALGDGQRASRRGAGGVQRTGGATLDAVRPWLAGQQGRSEPFFLFVHFFEPHTPYAPPTPYAERYGAASYAGEVAQADALVGALVDTLEGLGLYDDAAVMVLSDHGEGLGDHGEEEHGLLLYRESLQVPLILRLPGGTSGGKRVATPVGLVDVAPTLLQLAGSSLPADLDGQSLLATLEGSERGPVYSETFYPRLHFGWSELTSLIDGPHHYIQGPQSATFLPELYDVVADPAEQDDLLPSRRSVARGMRDRLAALDEALEAPGEVTPAQRRELAALGYVGDVGPVDPEQPRPHPKTQLGAVRQIKSCLRLYQAGQLPEAETACREASRQHPLSLDVWEHLARTRLELGRRGEALDALQRALDLAAGRAPHLAVSAASLLLEGRRVEDALALLERETVLAPEDLGLRLYLARTLVLVGRLGEALNQAEELVMERPDQADAVYLRGAIRMGMQDFEAGEDDLRRALTLAPDHTAALSDLAALKAHQGRVDEAAGIYRRLLALRPGDPAVQQALQRLESGR